MLTLDGTPGVQTDYLIDKEVFAFDQKGNLSISHKAVAIFMIGTGVFRLFSKEDFQEFFFRIALLYRYYGVLEKFFGRDYLFEAEFDGVTERIGPAGIARFIGAFSGFPTKNLTLDDWLEKLPERLKYCTLASIFSGISLFKEELEESEVPLDDPDITTAYTYRLQKELPSEKDIKNAGILASIIVNELPDDLFTAWKKKFPEAEEQYDIEANRKPERIFDYDALDLEVKEKVRAHLSQFFPEGEFEEEKVKALIYLAWLWANGLVYYTDFQGHDLYVIDRLYPFDYDLIELEDGGSNIEVTKDEYDLESLFSLLKIKNQ